MNMPMKQQKMKRQLTFILIYIDKYCFVSLDFVFLPQFFIKSGKLLTLLLKNPVCFFKMWETVVKPWTRQSKTKLSHPCLQFDGTVACAS